MNCSDTEEVINNVISLYKDCTVVQTANKHLAQITLDFYHTLISADINKGMEDDQLDYYGDGVWCIIQ